jgi:hypothetical protein
VKFSLSESSYLQCDGLFRKSYFSKKHIWSRVRGKGHSLLLGIHGSHDDFYAFLYKFRPSVLGIDDDFFAF